MTDQTQKCCTCKKEYPVAEFYLRSRKYRKTHVYTGECKSCCRVRAAANYHKNRKENLDVRLMDNKLCVRFLKQHTIMPTLWEMTL